MKTHSAPKNVWLATPEDQIKYTYGVDNHKKDSRYVQYTLHSEYEALEAENKSLEFDRDTLLEQCNGWIDTAKALQQQVESLKADAGRDNAIPDAPHGYTGVQNSELSRLREIEHRAWHVFGAMCDDGGEFYTIDKEISDSDLDVLHNLLPEDHPKIDAAIQAAGEEGK